MEQGLIDLLDTYGKEQGFPNRSEALRTLVRQALAHRVENQELVQGENQELVVGVISLVYPHGHELNRVPISPYPSITIHSNLQLHIQKNLLLKIIVVQGKAAHVQEWAKRVTVQKGIFGEFTISAIGDLGRSLGKSNWETISDGK